ncbi:hypothetical protein RA210_U110081 [Rubrivivax sp. A210]|nr:hypothetical protein RA210_U110081 [Rubrivivax sp. A210]
MPDSYERRFPAALSGGGCFVFTRLVPYRDCPCDRLTHPRVCMRQLVARQPVACDDQSHSYQQTRLLTSPPIVVNMAQ